MLRTNKKQTTVLRAEAGMCRHGVKRRKIQKQQEWLLWFITKFMIKRLEEEDIMEQILVVVDMQKDFIAGVLGSKEEQDIVGNVRKRFGRLTEIFW